MSAIEQIAISKLKLAEENVRREVGDLRELVASIKQVGVLEPLIVSQGDLRVVCGSRRLAAAKKAGLKEMPAIVKPLTETQRVQVSVIENLQRENLTPIEEAKAYERLAALELTQREIAKQVGVSQATVAKRLSLLKLPDDVQTKVDAGDVSIENAQALAKLDDNKIVERVVKKNIDRQIPAAVNRELEKKERQKKIAAAAKALEKQGETVVKISGDEWGYGMKAPKGMMLVTANRPTDYYGRAAADYVSMEPAEHAKLDCHAVGVHPGKFTPVEVCTTPSNHPDLAAEQKAEDAKREAEREKKQAAWDALTAKRREFVRSLITVTRGPQTELVIELALMALASGNGYGYGSSRAKHTIACALVGIEIADPDEEDEEEPVDLMEALREATGHDDAEPGPVPDPPEPLRLLDELQQKGPADKARVLMALSAAEFELDLGNGRGYGTEEYLKLLAGQGYELSKPEKQLAKE